MSANTDEITKLKNKLERHLDWHKDTEIEAEKRQLRRDTAYEQNMEAIAALTKSTQGVVDAWAAANNFQKFIKWLSGFALIGAMIAWAIKQLP